MGLRRRLVRRLAAKVKASYRALEDPAAQTMMDVDERDLLRFAEAAGFERIQLECHIDIEIAAHLRAIDLQTLLEIAPNPHARRCAKRSTTRSARRARALSRAARS